MPNLSVIAFALEFLLANLDDEVAEIFTDRNPEYFVVGNPYTCLVTDVRQALQAIQVVK